MPRLGLTFIGLASLCLIGGVSMGMYMGIAHDFQLAPVHAHLNLLGWASLALFGVTYCAVPQLAENRLAKVHLLLSGTSAPLFPIGIYLAIFHEDPTLTRITAPLWLLGAILFAAIVWGAILKGGRKASAIDTPLTV